MGASTFFAKLTLDHPFALPPKLDRNSNSILFHVTLNIFYTFNRILSSWKCFKANFYFSAALYAEIYLTVKTEE